VCSAPAVEDVARCRCVDGGGTLGRLRTDSCHRLKEMTIVMMRGKVVYGVWIPLGKV